MIVEDDFLQSEASRSALAGRGFAAQDRALGCIATKVVDVALVDLDLGEGPRLELASALQERRIPFLFITGWSDFVMPRTWRQAARVEKPVVYDRWRKPAPTSSSRP
jgi:hypothetical protein